MQKALATSGDAFPNGCVVYGLMIAPPENTLRNWWHRRILQYTPALLGDVRAAVSFSPSPR
jgi:hypothetical protein